MPPLEGDDEALPRACGWFESSHELRQGLAISEHAVDEVAHALSVGEWLDWRWGGATGNRLETSA